MWCDNRRQINGFQVVKGARENVDAKLTITRNGRKNATKQVNKYN